MSQDLVQLVSWSLLKLVYVTDSIVFVDTDDTITKNAAFTGVVAGDTTRIVIASAEDAGNDGEWAVEAAVANTLTVGTGGHITANADDDAAVIKGKYSGFWLPCHYYSRIVGIISSDKDVTFNTRWATSSSGGTNVTVATAITGGTPASIASEILGPFVRFDILNNDTATATLNGMMYAKSLT